jgi:hypothetical protein
MLVLDVDKLGRRQAKALRDLPSQQRFGLMVLAAFAAALTWLAVLFTLSGDSSPASAGRTGRAVTNVLAEGSSPSVESGSPGLNAPSPAAS